MAYYCVEQVSRGREVVWRVRKAKPAGVRPNLQGRFHSLYSSRCTASLLFKDLYKSTSQRRCLELTDICLGQRKDGESDKQPQP